MQAMKELHISKTLLAHQYETMRPKEVADHYGICLARLYRILDECGIPRKRTRREHRPAPTVIIQD